MAEGKGFARVRTTVERGYDRFNEHELPLRASALAFQAVFALLPCALLLLGVAALRQTDPEQVQKMAAEALGHLLPGTDTPRLLTKLMNAARLTDSVRRWQDGGFLATVVGVGAQLWAGSGLTLSLMGALGRLSGRPETRSIVRQRLTALMVFVLLFAMMALSLALSGLTAGPQFATLGPTIGRTLAIALDIMAFGAIYALLAPPPVSARAALRAGLTTGALWEISKAVFAFYIASSLSGLSVYGIVGAVFGLLTWVYITCLLFLCGGLVLYAGEAKG